MDLFRLVNEIINVIIDYAQHLAYLKIGMDALKGIHPSLPKHDDPCGGSEDDRLRAASNNFDILSDRSNAEKKFVKQRNSDINKKELDYAQGRWS